jgi:tetratricopeptide (TPR) repeat protein
MSRHSTRRPTYAAGPGRTAPADAGWFALNATPSRRPSPALRAAAWAAAALTAMALAWIAFARHPVGDYFTESDFYGYVEGARLIRHGHVDFSRYSVVGPLYELLLAALSLVVRDAFRAGELISIVSATGVLLLWAAIVRRRAGDAAAFWTVLFIAANPVFLRYGYSATTDMLAVLLQSAAAWAVLGVAEPRAAFAAGALVALAALARYSALYLVPAALACFLLWPAPGLAPRPTRARTIAWFVAGFAVLALPWLVPSLRAGHVPGANLFQSFSFYSDPSTSRNIQDAAPGAAPAGYRSLTDLLREHPGALIARLLANVPDHLARNLRSLVGMPVNWVCGLGLLFALLDGSWRRLLPVALTGALLFASLVPVFYSERYALPLVPYFMVLAGLAAGSPLLALRIGRPGLWLKGLAALWPLALSIQASVTLQRWVASQLPVEVIAAGRALRDVAPPGSGVLSRKVHLSYYSGLNPVAFPRFSRLAELADYCRRNGAQYLYFSWYEAELRPEFWYLLDSTAVVPGLTRIPFVAKNAALLFAIGPDFGRDPEWLASDSLTRIHVARAQVQALDDAEVWPAHCTLAQEAIERADTAAALEHLLAVTRGNPRLAWGWIRTGDLLLARGGYDQARAAYERARRLEPANVAALLGIGWTQMRTRRYELAAQTWAPLTGSTRDPETLRAMADVFERAGNSAALAEVQRALAALPPERRP